jgi:hypothetical protein
MDKSFKRTLLGLISITLFLFLTGIILFKTMFAAHYFWFFPFLILILFLMNTGFFAFFHRSLQKPVNVFIRNFMTSTGIKLIIYFVLTLSYIFTSPKTAIAFAVTLAVSYVIYTAYDLMVMLSLIKRNKEINNLSDHLSN